MSSKLPIDLASKTFTSKISVGAHERLKERAAEHGVTMAEILSACILHMPDEKLAEVLAAQKRALGALPKSVRGLLRDVDKLSDEQRSIIKDLL